MKAILKIILTGALIMYFMQPFADVAATDVESSDLSGALGYYVQKYKELCESTDTDEKVSLEDFFGREDPEEKDSFDENVYYDSFYSALPEEIRSEFPDSAEGVSYSDYGVNYFLGKVKESAKTHITPYLRGLSSIFSMLLVSAFVRRITEDNKSGVGETVGIICCIALCMLVISNGVFSPHRTGSYLVALSEVSIALMPILTLLMGATGNVAAAALTGQSMALVCAFLEALFSRVIYPLICASAGLSVAGCVIGDSTISSLSSFFRKVSNFLTVFSMTFLVFVLSVQKSLASSADTFGIKTVKFAVGNFIPLVGGAVSDTVNFVGAGFGYVKNTCGVLSLVVVFIVLLPLVLSLIFEKAVYSVASCAAGLLDLPSEKRLFSEFSALTDCLLALTLSACIVFFFIIINVINCGIRIGGY